MHSWQLQEAKARFSEVVDCAQKEGPQMITRRGIETVVIVPVDQWRREKVERKDPLLEILRSAPFDELLIPARGRLRHRKPINF